MFTGLVQAVGTLRERKVLRGGGMSLHVGAGGGIDGIDGAPLSMADVVHGESIAVSGVCLTVVAFDADGFWADVSDETLACTTLGMLPDGAPVNLERALLATDRLGGHLVAGHVDAIGHVEAIERAGNSSRWRFAAPAGLHRYFAAKGSVCVDGVSLTINAIGDTGFEVNLVPHTIAHTAFGATRVGAPVNLEVDVVARYVERLLASRDPQPRNPHDPLP